MTARTRVVGAAAAIIVAAAGAAVFLTVRDASGTQPPATTGPPMTATVARETLVRIEQVDGELGYGTAIGYDPPAGGTITWLPEVGTVVKRGGTLLRVDDAPVVLLHGELPMYRTLAPGAKGRDVAQLERNLRELGYDGFTVDDTYTWATADAVRRWQRALGRERTGTVAPDWVLMAPVEVRIDTLRALAGAPTGGTALTWTGTRKVVTAQVDAGDPPAWATEGTEVTVVLPGGTETAGTVGTVGTQASTPEDEPTADPAVPVIIELADPAAATHLDQAPVQVHYVSEERPDVLAVPVSALLALAEGGYGLEIVADDGTTRYLAVDVGMFSDGLVEVSADGLAEGATVGMPS